MNGELTQEQLAQLEQLKKLAMKKILSKEALERLGRIRLVKPELASQIELYLLQLYQVGKIKSELSDEEFKNILESVSTKKEYKIRK